MFRSLHISSSVVHIKSTVNIQLIRVCYNVTVSLKDHLSVIYKLIQRNVKKAEKKIVETHRKKLCNLTRNRSLPFQTEDTVKNLSDYRLNTEEIDLLKNGLNFSIPSMFIKKTDVFCQFEMIAKFLTQDIEENEVSTQLKSELTHLANCCDNKYTPSKSS